MEIDSLDANIQVFNLLWSLRAKPGYPKSFPIEGKGNRQSITLEIIYTLLEKFNKVYDKINDEEKKSLISSLIKEIEIFPCDEAELPYLI